LDEFNTTVFDQISNSYKRLPEPTRPLPEPTPLAEPSPDSLTTPSSSIEPPLDEEDSAVPTPSKYKNDDEEYTESDYEDHESSSSIATVRSWNKKNSSLNFIGFSHLNMKNIFMMMFLNMMMKLKN
jgi:hypothetical protein